jgi:hypothetical protein
MLISVSVHSAVSHSAACQSLSLSVTESVTEPVSHLMLSNEEWSMSISKQQMYVDSRRGHLCCIASHYLVAVCDYFCCAMHVKRPDHA